jgi:hypothetical protein
MVAITIADIPRVMQRLREHFATVEVVADAQRPFTPREYDDLDPGLFEYLAGLRTRGISDFREAFGGEYVFRSLVIRAAGVRAP